MTEEIPIGEEEIPSGEEESTTIIQSLQTYIATCPLLSETELAPLVNWVDPTPNSYGIFPIPGDKQIYSYPAKGGMYEFPFALQVNASNADDLARLQTQGFFEQFGKWLDAQNEAENYPVLSSGETAFEIEALGQGYLLDQGDSDVSTYEVPCRLTYERI